MSVEQTKLSPAWQMFCTANSDAACPDAHRQRRHAAFQRRDALLEHGLGRVHDARVDVAEFLEREQVAACSVELNWYGVV